MVPTRCPSAVLTKLLAAAILLTSLAAASEGGVKSGRYEFQVTPVKLSYSPNEKILASFRLRNLGRRPAAIAKPLFPTGWEVRYRPHNDQGQQRSWEGWILQGATQSGAPPRYRDEDYVLMAPGGSHLDEIDLSSCLRDQSTRVASGVYEIVFSYQHPPSEAERDIPLISQLLRSNVVRVLVSDE